MFSRPRILHVVLGLGLAGAIGASITFHLLQRDDDDAHNRAIKELQAGHAARDSLRFADAERHYRLALGIHRPWYAPWSGQHPSGPWWILQPLGEAVAAQGCYDEAEPLLLAALGSAEADYGPRGESLIAILGSLRDFYTTTGRDSLADACSARRDSVARYVEPIHRAELDVQRRFGRGGGRVLSEKLIQLGDLHYQCGRGDLAEPLFEEAYAIRLRIYGPDHAYTVGTLGDLGYSCTLAGKHRRATKVLREVLVKLERDHGRESPCLIPVLGHLAKSAYRRSRYTEAESLFARALIVQERLAGQDHVTSVPTLEWLALCRAGLRDGPGAYETYDRVIGIHRRLFGSDSRQVGRDLFRLANLEYRAGRLDRARATCRLALGILTRTAGSQDDVTLRCREAYEKLAG